MSMARHKVVVSVVFLVFVVSLCFIETKGTTFASDEKTAQGGLSSVGNYSIKDVGGSYQVKRWFIQWEINTGRPDKIWVVFSQDETTPIGMARAYWSLDQVHTLVDAMDRAKANKQELWFWYKGGKWVLLTGSKQPIFPPE
jgi:hypothetical protein